MFVTSYSQKKYSYVTSYWPMKIYVFSILLNQTNIYNLPISLHPIHNVYAKVLQGYPSG